ncbi:MAG: CRTAC1 family protein [Gammaproteobacteria bacterium]|nr:CRTAC1 family protein [Gammaproteobacteria bacterium]
MGTAPAALSGSARALLFGALAWAFDASGGVRFVDATDESGLDFTHLSGMTGELWTLEIIGAGVGILDYDGDGRMDLWLVQGGPLVGRATAELPSDRLFRNVGEPGELAFEDVTERAGIAATGYGMGIATADVDSDGDTDVFLANYGANELWLNLGDGGFRDATADSGIVGERWSISASIADVDGDGLLDLYVANYLDFAIDTAKPCRLAGQRSYCPPSRFPGVGDRLYRNLGGGRFQDVTVPAGIDAARAAGMGVIADDFDDDGHVDFYVANDGSANVLWINDGTGRFTDTALRAGAAVNGAGSAEASMGVTAADFDADGDSDLFVTHDTGETNTLYVNHGRGTFEDRTDIAGLAAGSLAFTGFGTGWVDVDNDGDLDLFAANGTVRFVPRQLAASAGPPLRQRNQLWLNDGTRYRRAEGGPAFALEHASRGTAFGDLDNDGDIDMVVANNHTRARLYRNDTPRASWLGVIVDAGTSPPIGARVWIDRPGIGPGRVRTDGSYASAHDPRVVFGLGLANEPRSVTVRWPDGVERQFGPLPVNRYHILRKAR